MSPPQRLGFNISPAEPFWVQVREAVLQRAQELDVELIPINAEDHPPLLSEQDEMALVEEILGQALDAIISCRFNPRRGGRRW
jgi:hypothetical protein